jgi:hypothetical protein
VSRASLPGRWMAHPSQLVPGRRYAFAEAQYTASTTSAAGCETTRRHKPCYIGARVLPQGWRGNRCRSRRSARPREDDGRAPASWHDGGRPADCQVAGQRPGLALGIQARRNLESIPMLLDPAC